MIKEQSPTKRQKDKDLIEALCVSIDQRRERVAYGHSYGFVLCDIAKKERQIKQLDYSVDLVRFTHENTLVTLTKDPDGNTSRLAVWRTSTDLEVLASSIVKRKLCSMEIAPGKIVLACPLKVYVLDSSTLTLLCADETFDNAEGRFAVSMYPSTLTLAYPKTKKGSVKLVNLKEWREGSLYSCHQSAIRYVGITNNAERFTTCSFKFTVVRIFNSETGDKLQQVWIGGNRLQPIRMKFSSEGDWLAVLMVNGDLKIFSSSLTQKEKISTKKYLQVSNPISSFFYFSYFKESLGQEQPFSEYKLESAMGEGQADIVFAPPSTWLTTYPKPSEGCAIKLVELVFDPIHGGKCFKTVIDSL